jgi:thiol-disulfide isomerase/thioredoxin
MWLRQLADTVSAATQSGEYPGGVKRLEALLAKLERSDEDAALVAYVRFRQLMADYGLSIQTASTEEFVKIQTDWLKDLEQYAEQYPNSPDAAEAMLQLGIAQEYAGEEEEAKRWYARVERAFPTSAPARKAAGARTRLESVGKTISFRGRSPSGESVDLAAYRGKVVLIQYWASWCEPCKADMATLKELLARYGRSGFSIIGVNLDTKREDMAAFLSETRIPWPQIYEEGGLESRPANELGILTLPTMLLVDQQGRVVNRNVHVVELERELKGLIR